MRPTRLLLLLASAGLIAGCGSVAAPRPDSSGDAAFVSQLQSLCAHARELRPLGGSLPAGTSIANARANKASVLGVEDGVLKLAPSLSMSSPLAPAITDMEAMLLDASMRYETVAKAAGTNHPRQLNHAAGLAAARITRAHSDMVKLGVNGCLP
ncbi:MAG: hypothetical protein ACRDKL_08230 [Solirubrobacteraceae bacterium]